MRKAFLLISVLFLAFSCVEKEDFASPFSEESTPLSKYALSGSDIFRLSDNTRAANSNSYIEYLTYKGDTVLYLLHKGNGFELYPSDQRFAPVIAFNENEDIDLDSICPAQKEWFEQLKESIYNFRHFDSTTVNSNVDEWNHVLKRKRNAETRLYQEEGGEQGEWFLYKTEIEEESHVEEPHLIKSWYYEERPYNMYCPLNSFGNDNCKAGSGAVAAAQIISYLHDTYGWAKKTVNDATYDETHNKYIFSNWSEKAWDGSYVMHKVIGNIGVLASAEYGDSFTKIPTLSIQQALNRYGIKSTYGKWNLNIIHNNLSKKLPVYALLKKKNSNLEHAIVVDGFRYDYYRYIDTYIFISREILDDYNGCPYDFEDEDFDFSSFPKKYETYSFSDFYFQINWGGRRARRDDTFYHSSSTLKWDEDTYDGEKEILYNFQNIE